MLRQRLKVLRVTAVALLAATSVSFAGIISFVGLIAPHILRMLTGPSNRWLPPLSALDGARMLSASDITARTLIPLADLPIGIFAALAGGPLFFVLLRRTLKQTGAW